MVASNSAASSSPSFSAIAGTKTVAPALTFLPHPYMQECFPRSSRTLNDIWKFENSVLNNKIIGRSKWQSYPLRPRQKCYERQERSSNNEMRTASTTTTTTIGSSITFPANDEEDRRITALNMGDNTFVELLRLYLIEKEAARVNHHTAPTLLPRVPSLHLRPYWIMTKDIAILDQLESIELFRCTGILPKSMNHLIKLTRLQLKDCRVSYYYTVCMLYYGTVLCCFLAFLLFLTCIISF